MIQGSMRQLILRKKDYWSEIAVGNIHSLAIKSDGTLWIWGSNFDGQLGEGVVIQDPTWNSGYTIFIQVNIQIIFRPNILICLEKNLRRIIE
jgi:alpha-tubulin suppressor-like RCC1 family protein